MHWPRDDLAELMSFLDEQLPAAESRYCASTHGAPSAAAFRLQNQPQSSPGSCSTSRIDNGTKADVRGEAGVRGRVTIISSTATPSTATTAPAPRRYDYDSYVQPKWITAATANRSNATTLESALDDLDQPVSEISPPDGHLAVPLMKHQRVALWWMIEKETVCSKTCAGGILADDQGLGKTLSTIALIITERPPPPQLTLMGSEEDTVDLVSSDDEDDEDFSLVGRNPLRKKSKTLPAEGYKDAVVPSPMSRPRRPAGGTLVVCPTSVLRQWADEIRNKVTRKANLSFLVHHGPTRTKDPNVLAKYDVVLTTYAIVSMEVPKEALGNGHDDVDKDWLVDDPTPYSKKRKSPPSGGRKPSEASSPWPLAMVSWFRVVLDEAQTIKNHTTLAARACSKLRAKRRWCLSGTPIQNSITDLYSYFRFLRYEPYATYHIFDSKIRFQIHLDPTIGYPKLQAVLKKVMLRRTKETLIDGQPIVKLPPKKLEMKALDFSKEERAFYDDLETMSLEQFEEYKEAGTISQNYANILVLLLRLRQACDHPALTPFGESMSSSSVSASKSAEKLGKDKCLELLKCLAASQALCAVCSDPPEDGLVSVCRHVFCSQCISGRLSGDDDEAKACPHPSCKKKLSSTSVFTKACLQSCINGDVQTAGGLQSSGGASFTDVNPVGLFRVGSSKIEAAMEVLSSLPVLHHSNAGRSTEKALVFSQWTKMLDLLEKRLRNSGISYRRLDGTMSVADRERAVRDFNSKPEVTVMLMSLKAASLGLNMVASNHVLLLDPWWNSTTEEQAIDRAHRIGQTRPVKVTRFTVKDTVEDRILNLQEKKRQMVASAFGEVQKGSRQSRLSEEELSYLFKGQQLGSGGYKRSEPVKRKVHRCPYVL